MRYRPPAELMGGADTVGLNMARQLGDGEQIRASSALQDSRGAGQLGRGAGTPGPAGTSGTATTGPKTASTAGGARPQHCDRGAARRLPGIGPVTAAAMAWRQRNGRVHQSTSVDVSTASVRRGWTSGAIWSVSDTGAPYGLRRVPFDAMPGPGGAGQLDCDGGRDVLDRQRVCLVLRRGGPRRRRTVVVCGAPVVARSATGFGSAPASRSAGARVRLAVALRLRRPIATQSPWHLGTSALVMVTPSESQCRWGKPADVPGRRFNGCGMTASAG